MDIIKRLIIDLLTWSVFSTCLNAVLFYSQVCEEARCPNIGECWGGGEYATATATIMVKPASNFKVLV